MNRENILKIADFIESEDERIGFSMHSYVDVQPHRCGTTCCIAGTAAFLSGMRLNEMTWQDAEEGGIEDVAEAAAAFMGIRQGGDLWRNTVYPKEMSDITRAIAVRYLRTLAETGVASWKAAGHTSDGAILGDEFEAEAINAIDDEFASVLPSPVFLTVATVRPRRIDTDGVTVDEDEALGA